MKRIGIFAGTFDPIHDGHIAFAQAALDQGIEKVMFLVEPRPRRKQGVRALEHRIAMVQLAIAKQPKMGTIMLEQARFTAHETLPVLQERFKGYKLVLLFGDDVTQHIAQWPHVTQLVESTELLIASRQANTDMLRETMHTLEHTRSLKFHYNIIKAPKEYLSASKIRLQLKRHEKPEGLPPKVYGYITQQDLYGKTDEF
jgi:nicotinate-nucleotide adenylyltransferase